MHYLSIASQQVIPKISDLSTTHFLVGCTGILLYPVFGLGEAAAVVQTLAWAAVFSGLVWVDFLLSHSHVYC